MFFVSVAAISLSVGLLTETCHWKGWMVLEPVKVAGTVPVPFAEKPGD